MTNDVVHSSQNEIEKLKSQLNDMKARCEKAEKEKSEILLRRLATMETMTNKTSTGEVAKLQKKNEGIRAWSLEEVYIYLRNSLYIRLQKFLLNLMLYNV